MRIGVYEENKPVTMTFRPRFIDDLAAYAKVVRKEGSQTIDTSSLVAFPETFARLDTFRLRR